MKGRREGVSQIYIVFMNSICFVGCCSFEDFLFLRGGNSSCSISLRGYGKSSLYSYVIYHSQQWFTF